MKSRELLSETIDELTLEECRVIDGGGNPVTNLAQSIISSALVAYANAAGTMGNCVTLAKNYFKTAAPETPTTGVGCTKR